MIKTITLIFLVIVFATNSFAQNAEASINSDLPKVTAKVEAPAASVLGKEVVINFRSMSERPVGIFAGPKENIRNPKISTFGGLSNYQKLYLRENEVVCLMYPDKAPKACVVIKPGITGVEVNSSGTVISGK